MVDMARTPVLFCLEQSLLSIVIPAWNRWAPAPPPLFVRLITHVSGPSTLGTLRNFWVSS